MKASIAPTIRNDDEFPDLLKAVQHRFWAYRGVKLFTTDAEGLFSDFLYALPDEIRQTYTCRCCRQFIEAYGGLVAIDGRDGTTLPVMWSPTEDVPEVFRFPISVLFRAVEHARVTGVFLPDEEVLGKPETGFWHHLAVAVPPEQVFHHAVKMAGQAEAEKKEERAMLARGLAEFSIGTAGRALELLRSGQLFRGEKTAETAEWFLTLHHQLRDQKDKRKRENIVWFAAAAAPAGWCHVRSGIIGTLLSDLEERLPFSSIKERWDAKMNPLRYQRPQAAPTEGNIKQAEEIVSKLGIARSLERRFATLADVQVKLWEPKEPKHEPGPGGVFGHLLPNTQPGTMDLGEQKMTLVRFLADVAPNAEKIEWAVPQSGNLSALTTAVHLDAPPILQWDDTMNRNPVASYVYNNTPFSPRPDVRTWGLTPGNWESVTAITPRPKSWSSLTQPWDAVFLLLARCRDYNTGQGLALFPECLRSELHEIRSTIEAFSKKGTLSGREEASACGVMLQRGINWTDRFRVTSKGIRTVYQLDRWD